MPDLTPFQMTAMAVPLVIQIVLLVVGLREVRRTPESKMTLSKTVWTVICLVPFVGPVAFFIDGRKKPEPE